MNKKGEDLPKNTLGTVLAIVATVMLIAGFFLAYMKLKDNEMESAQNLVEKIKARAELLSQGDSINFTIQGFKPKTNPWYLMGFDKTMPDRPDACFLKNCICVCNGANPIDCQNKGFCREINSERISVNTLDIEIFDYPVEDDAPDHRVLYLPIEIKPNLIVLEITREDNILYITHYTPEYKDYLKTENE